MRAAANREAVERAVELWNAHDDRYFEAYAEGAPIHGFPPDVPETVEGMSGLFHQMWSSFPDIRVDILRLVAEGDLAAGNMRISGTHQGEFMGASPTGSEVAVDAMTFVRFDESGKVAERWTRLDDVALLTQLGLMPAPAGAPA